ncbi:MAG: ferredoxin [Alphaproteobacteria bacterium]
MADSMAGERGWHDDLAQRLATHGLQVRGAMHPAAGDGAPALASGAPALTLVLVGNAGADMWTRFADGPEAGDGAPHPLNRWTRRVVGEIATRCGADAVYPFDGPPWPPFLAWARQADRVFPSPLGLLIHADYGLWHAYRAALLFAERLTEQPAMPRPAPAERPCDTCAGKPCLSACPVGAFDGRTYDVAACRDHLHTVEGKRCMSGGCLARHACPIGPEWAYGRDHASFHMTAFRRG